MKHPDELHTELKAALNNYIISLVNTKTETILKRLMRVLIQDGEQFVAGEIQKIAKENGIILQNPIDSR